MKLKGIDAAINAISWNAADTSFPFVADYTIDAASLIKAGVATEDGDIDGKALKRLLVKRLESDYGKGVRNIAFKYETLWKTT